MLQEEICPIAISIGISYWDFGKTNPRILKTIAAGYIKQKTNDDFDLWRLGIYMQRSLAVTIDQCFNGINAKTKYFEKPLLLKDPINSSAENDILTEEEKENERKALLMRLQIMEYNFNAARNGKK